MPSRYPTAPVQYDPKQIDQLTRTLINDLAQLSQQVGIGYATGGFSAARALTGGDRTYGVGEIGTVSVSINGGIDVLVNSGTPADAYNVGQVLSALITDMKLRGLLG